VRVVPKSIDAMEFTTVGQHRLIEHKYSKTWNSKDATSALPARLPYGSLRMR
jgi:hypothetical protein